MTSKKDDPEQMEESIDISSPDRVSGIDANNLLGQPPVVDYSMTGARPKTCPVKPVTSQKKDVTKDQKKEGQRTYNGGTNSNVAYPRLFPLTPWPSGPNTDLSFHGTYSSSLSKPWPGHSSDFGNEYGEEEECSTVEITTGNGDLQKEDEEQDTGGFEELESDTSCPYCGIILISSYADMHMASCNENPDVKEAAQATDVSEQQMEASGYSNLQQYFNEKGEYVKKEHVEERNRRQEHVDEPQQACAYCDRKYEPSFIPVHQSQCINNPEVAQERQVNKNERHRACAYCGRKYDPSFIPVHMTQCVDNPDVVQERREHKEIAEACALADWRNAGNPTPQQDWTAAIADAPGAAEGIVRAEENVPETENWDEEGACASGGAAAAPASISNFVFYDESDDTMIPCEFCTILLPVYAIEEHQRHCEFACISH